MANGKTVSLCSNGSSGVAESLVYRYGSASKIELEFLAPDEGLFFYDFERNDSKSVDYKIYFNKGDTRYQISICHGMTCESEATHLIVFQNKKIVAKLGVERSSAVDNIFGELITERRQFSSKALKKERAESEQQNVNTNPTSPSLNLNKEKRLLDYQCLLAGHEASDGKISRALGKSWVDARIEADTITVKDEDTKSKYIAMLVRTDKDKDGSYSRYCDINSCRKFGMVMTQYSNTNRAPMLMLSTTSPNGGFAKRYYNCSPR